MHLGGVRSAARDYTQLRNNNEQDYSRLQQVHIHLGELEEGVDVDVAVKHVHGGSR